MHTEYRTFGSQVCWLFLTLLGNWIFWICACSFVFLYLYLCICICVSICVFLYLCIAHLAQCKSISCPARQLDVLRRVSDTFDRVTDWGSKPQIMKSRQAVLCQMLHNQTFCFHSYSTLSKIWPGVHITGAGLINIHPGSAVSNVTQPMRPDSWFHSYSKSWSWPFGHAFFICIFYLETKQLLNCSIHICFAKIGA